MGDNQIEKEIDNNVKAGVMSQISCISWKLSLTSSIAKTIVKGCGGKEGLGSSGFHRGWSFEGLRVQVQTGSKVVWWFLPGVGARAKDFKVKVGLGLGKGHEDLLG